jgi:ferric-dicitrate binding protein FerR (iron transport regulator)
MDKEALRDLMADYLEGELDESKRAELADALEQNPELTADFNDALWMEGLLYTACKGTEVSSAGKVAQQAKRMGPSGRFSFRQPNRSASAAVWLGVAAMLLMCVIMALLALRPDDKPNEVARKSPVLVAGAIEVNGVRQDRIAYGQRVSVVGEAPAEIRLDDASTAKLDPGSRALFMGQQGDVRQLVELRAGKGAFEVRHEPHAFKVATVLGSVTVTGTEFTVELKDAQTEAQPTTTMVVEVEAGRVSVEYQRRQFVLSAGAKRVFGAEGPQTLRGAYAVNGQLHVNTFGMPEAQPITTGHADMKPSWSKTGDMLVFFRVVKSAESLNEWKTAICVINADGTGFHPLSDGTHTDYNPTWTRDGSNRAIFNRRNPKTGAYIVMQSEADGKPGDEVPISDTDVHTYAYSCLKDGRILVSAKPGPLGYFLMTPVRDGTPRYEAVQCDLAEQGLLDRISISPDETRICFEFQEGHGKPQYPGRALYIADFDAEARAITNPKVIAEGGTDWDVNYPRWTRDGSALLYQSTESGKSQLYLYRLEDGSSRRISSDDGAEYLFASAEDTPL